MFGKRLIFSTLVMCILVAVVGACGRESPDEEHFDLDHPPQGWSRFVDPVMNYTIWLPYGWRPVVIQNAPDITVPTYYHPPSRDMGEVGVDRIWQVEFGEDAHDLVWQTMGRGGFSEAMTYTLYIDSLTIPCIRWTRDIRYIGLETIHRVNHECVVKQYEDIYWQIGLSTENQWESELEPTWRLMVTSFALEQSQ